MRTADDALQRGDCSRAMSIIEPSARQGQPWAQVRTGLLYLQGQCKPRDFGEARSWFLRAATYESKTSWEKGSDISTSPTGFFNARASAANASFMLMEIYAKGLGVDPDVVESWLWAHHAVNQFAETESGRSNAEQALRAVESMMMPEQMANARARASSWKPRAP